MTFWAENGYEAHLVMRETPEHGMGIRYNATDNKLYFDRYAASTTPSTVMTILRDSEQIGIGTTSPTAQLHTTGTVRFANYTDGFLQVDGSGNLSVGNGSDLFTAGDGLSWNSNTLNSNWKTSGNNIYSANTGNVGIGTASPTNKLELVEGIFHIEKTDFGFITMKRPGFGSETEWLISPSSNFFSIFSDDALRIRAENVDKFAFGADGNFGATGTGYFQNNLYVNNNVGINRTNPAQKLDVLGTIRSSDPSYSTSRWIDIYSNAAQVIETTNDLYIGTTNTSSIHLQPGRLGTGEGHVHIRNSTGTNWASFDGTNERLGVGTNSPTYKLHVTTSSSDDNYVGYFNRPSGNYGTGRATIYGYRYGASGEANGGSAYSTYNSDNAIQGYSYYGNNYSFGVAGFNYNDYTRCGGTIGANSGGTYWGSLGYKNSASNTYGAYWTNSGSGSGFNTAGNAYAGIGAGGVGDMLGFWSKGNVMGQIVAGELFSSYNLGNTYTAGTQVEIIDTGNEKVPAYSVTSREMKVYDNGFAQISGHEIFVPFDQNFTVMIKNERPVVTITPIGQNADLFIKSITTDGFTVACDTHQSIEFSWISVGTRVDNEKIARLPEDLKNTKFDENLKEFMFNENNHERNAKAMWWDGNNIHFGILPNYLNKTEPKHKEKEVH